MKLLGLILVTVWMAAGQQTTIAASNLLGAGGKLASGTVTAMPTATFVTPGGLRVPKAAVTAKIVNGRVTMSLWPNDSASVPCRYTATWQIDGMAPRTETWYVITSTAPLSLAAVVTAASAAADSGSAFVDGDIPLGLANGTNAIFFLARLPQAGESVILLRNGISLTQGYDFMLAGQTVTFSPFAVPQSGDSLIAYYRTAAVTGFNYASGERPVGAIDGTNGTFGLANAPSPASSLFLTRNGLPLAQGTDYTLSGWAVTFAGAAVPQPGDSLTAAYRYTIAGVAE